MTDQPDSYYEEWADRLNRKVSGLDVNAEFVRTIERLSGKPIGEMSIQDWDAAHALHQAESTVKLSRLNMSIEDMTLFKAAMEQRGVNTVDELFTSLRPGDDDYVELMTARHRLSAILRLEADE